MFGISLLVIFFLYFSSSFAQSCSSQPLSANLDPIFLENFKNGETKLLLIKKCLSNLKDCAKGILLKNVVKDAPPPSGTKTPIDLLSIVPFHVACNEY